MPESPQPRHHSTVSFRAQANGSTFNGPIRLEDRFSLSVDNAWTGYLTTPIICGQGTIALEIMEDLPDVDTVLVPLSGGGLISGIALGTKFARPDAKIVGISMERAAVMIESLKAGHPIEMPEEPTLADSLLGGIGLDNEYTFDIVRDMVDETAQVSEKEIADGVAYIMENHKVIAEGASAVGVAYAMREGNIRPGSKVAIVVTGCGIDMKTVKEILDERY